MANNVKISQLVELTAGEVKSDDLLLIIDVHAKESKKIQASSLASWLNVSGSFVIDHARLSDTASYIFGYNVNGDVSSAIFATSAISSSWASRSFSSSHALTAAFAQSGGGGVTPGGSYDISCSWASRSLNANNANNAVSSNYTTFLVYSPTNGTASYSIKSGLTDKTIKADTASYFDNDIGTVKSASHADTASYLTTTNISAAYLIYSPTNGTASYAVSAGSIVGVMNNYGMFNALIQSTQSAIIPNLTVSSSLGIPQPTMIQAIGNAKFNFTASSPYIDSYIYLYGLNRFTGESNIFDTSYMYFDMTPVINTWGTPASGTINLPFNLVGQDNLYGQYYFAVSSSNPNLVIYTAINNNRPVKFLISSYSDKVSVSYDQYPQFSVFSPYKIPTMSFYTSSVMVNINDTVSGMLTTGSQYIIGLNMSNQSASLVKYLWTLSNLQVFDCSINPLLTDLSYGIPTSMITMSCFSCSINNMSNFDNTTASYLNFSRNQFATLPTLSPSTSYLNCSYNPLITLPTLPASLKTLIFNDTIIYGIIPALPSELQTASLFNNRLITSLSSPLPISLSYLDIHNNPLMTSIPTAPISLSYLDISNTIFSTTVAENITNQLISNAQVSGTLKVIGYGPTSSYTPTLLSNYYTLTGSGYRWTIYTD